MRARTVPCFGRRAAAAALPFAAALALALGPSTAAWASPFQVYGFGSRGTAMGGAQGAAARDHSAVYYNPANLVLREKTHFGLSLNLVAPSLFVEQPAEESVPPLLPTNNVGLTVGLNFPLGGLIDYRAAVGLAIFLPLLELTRLEAVDPARPYFYLYSSLPDHLVIAPAVGFRVTDWLRVGVGVQILAAFESEVTATGDVLRRRIETRSLAVELSGRTAVVAGLSSTLGPVELGLTFRDALRLDYAIPVDFRFTGVGTLTLDVSGTTLYSARELNLGLAVRLEEPALLLAADLTAAFWGAAPDPTVAVFAEVSDEEIRPNEDEVGSLFDLRTERLALGAQDILIPRLGVEWRPDEVFAVRAGYFHRPAMLPDQTGYGAFLDAAANVFSLGAGATFADPLHVAEEPMTIDMHVQLVSLRTRRYLKSEEDGASYDGAFGMGGTVWNVGLEVWQDF